MSDRYIDNNERFKNVNWQGVDPDVLAFRDELYKRFPKLRVTSEKRNKPIGATGGGSRHIRGQAMDLEADPEVHKFLYSTDGNALLLKYNLGFLDETISENLKKTGGTGPHLHIGKDSTLKGNSYHGNTAFKRETSPAPAMSTPTQTTPTNTGGSPIVDPNNVNQAYNLQPNAQNLEFIQNQIAQNLEAQKMLQEQVNQQQETANRQNAIQEKLKEKMENQLRVAEMIKSNDLGIVKRNRGRFLEEGGYIDQESSDEIDHKIGVLKSLFQNSLNVPVADVKDSDAYKELQSVNSNLESLYALYNTESSKGSNGTVVNNYYYNNGDSDHTHDEESTEETPSNANVQGDDVASKLYNAFRGIGLEAHQASGAIGSLTGESSINLNARALNPHSKAFGIAQWLGDRLTALRTFAKEKGRDFKNEDIQIEFLLHELGSTEKAALNAIKKAKTLEEATSIWTTKFERPSEKEVRDSIGTRIKNAKTMYSRFSK